MAVRAATTKITLYACVNDSTVLNEIAVITQDVMVEPITDENRKPGDAAEAVMRVTQFDLVTALRDAADRLEAGRTND